MKLPKLLLAGTVLLLLALPATAQQVDAAEQARRFPNVPTPTTLYFHINGFQDFPINTQAPSDEFAQSESIGTLTYTNTCMAALTGQDVPQFKNQWHTSYGYISPSYVQYEKLENGKPRIHQERGISYDVQIGGNFELKWYVETQVTPGELPADVNAAPVVIPSVKVMATMRAGDAISVGNEAYDEGALIAQGVAGPFVLAAGGNGTVPQNAAGEPSGRIAYSNVNGRHIYEFTVPMTVPAPGIIPRADGGNVRIDMYLDNAICPADPAQGTVMPNTVRVHTSPDFRPRIEMVVNNPIMIPYLHPQFVAGDLVVHTQLNSPWGNYDVDEGPDGITVNIANTAGTVTARTIQRASFVQHALDHNKHQDAVDVTYLWDFDAEAAPDGVYEVVVRVKNDQGTAEAVGTSKFAIGNTGDLPPCDEDIPIEEQVNCIPVAPESKQESPGAGILVAGVLAACAFVARRRLL